MFSIKAIYEQYKQDVFQYLVSITHNVSLSEDLTSETFLAAIGALSRFEGNSDVKTWLFSIARHKWYEHLRKEKPMESMSHFITNYMSEESEPDQIVTQNDIIERILELLSKENTRTKSIVMLRIEGYSFYEIARKYGISESSARVIDFRAKKKLKETLTKEGFYNE